jgi:hypothetical protein
MVSVSAIVARSVDGIGYLFDGVRPVRRTRKAEPPADCISVEPNLTNACVFAHLLAELVAPPTMGHQAETPATVIADLMLGRLRVSHYARARRLRRVP